MSFITATNFRDSAGPTFSGGTTIPNGTLGVDGANNAIQIGAGSVAVAVPHNASVVPANAPNTTAYDVTIYASDLISANVSAMGFVCNLVNLNGNANTPQCYVKLKAAAGSAHDMIIPLVPGQVFTWNPPGTVPSIGANTLMNNVALAANTTSITVTPDPTSDLSINATIEMIA